MMVEDVIWKKFWWWFGGGRSSAPREGSLHQEEGSGGLEATDSAPREGGFGEEKLAQRREGGFHQKTKR
jgi:hypothetical protein